MRWGEGPGVRREEIDLGLFARALGAATDERRACDVVRRYVSDMCGAETVVLIACGPERGRATFRDDPRSPTTLAAGPAGSCLTVRLGRPHARRRSDEPLLACELCGRLDADTACAPLTAAGTVLGAVMAAGPELAGDAERRLDDIAAVAGPALAALRSFDLAGAHAHTDALTGLPNRRAAEESTDRMLAFARRTTQTVAVMRIDVDGSGARNARLGTEAGDAVLQSLATLLASRLRQSDLVARYGGDEFLVLLPETPSEFAVQLGNGLRELARELTPSGAADPVTVSVGVASFPYDGEHTAEVLAAAERALLRCKAAGGDLVAASEPPDPSQLLD